MLKLVKVGNLNAPASPSRSASGADGQQPQTISAPGQNADIDFLSYDIGELKDSNLNSQKEVQKLQRVVLSSERDLEEMGEAIETMNTSVDDMGLKVRFSFVSLDSFLYKVDYISMYFSQTKFANITAKTGRNPRQQLLHPRSPRKWPHQCHLQNPVSGRKYQERANQSFVDEHRSVAEGVD